MRFIEIQQVLGARHNRHRKTLTALGLTAVAMGLRGVLPPAKPEFRTSEAPATSGGASPYDPIYWLWRFHGSWRRGGVPTPAGRAAQRNSVLRELWRALQRARAPAPRRRSALIASAGGRPRPPQPASRPSAR